MNIRWSLYPDNGVARFWSVVAQTGPQLGVGREDWRKGSRQRDGGFTKPQRYQMLRLFDTLDFRFASHFLSLTFGPEDFPIHRAQACIRSWVDCVHAKYPGIFSIQRLEAQTRGTPHYHVVFYGLPIIDVAEFRMWWIRRGGGFIRAKRVKSHGVGGYLSKMSCEMGKVKQTFPGYTGRHWGVKGDSTPFLARVIDGELPYDRARELSKGCDKVRGIERKYFTGDRFSCANVPTDAQIRQWILFCQLGTVAIRDLVHVWAGAWGGVKKDAGERQRKNESADSEGEIRFAGRDQIHQQEGCGQLDVCELDRERWEAGGDYVDGESDW